MSEDWPPGGYSPPVEYERSELLAILIAVVVGISIASVTVSAIQSAAGNLIEAWVNFAQTIGMGPLPLVIGAHLGWISWILILSILMIALHESVHFGIGRLLGMAPKFELDDFAVLKNPSVVILSDGIKRWENLAMLSGPFVLIGSISLIIMVTTDGVVSGSAAYILLINSAASGLDIYHIIRLLLMPKGTQYANFRDGGELRTEYTVPEE